MNFITETSKQIKVVDDVDIVVLGGSSTGVFAAVRAARLGAKVAIVERTNAFGGTGSQGMMCMWDTLYDTTFKKQIIAGLTQETLERLKRIPNAVDINEPEPDAVFRLSTIGVHRVNSEELKIELDNLIKESNVHPYLHTFYSTPYLEDGKLTAIITESKAGRCAIRAKYFIDATADGDLGIHMGMETYHNGAVQPASTACKIYGYEKLKNPDEILRKHEERIGCNIGWDTWIAGTPHVRSWYKTNVLYDCSDGEQLTAAEIEGRAQIRRMMDVLRENDPAAKDLVLLSLASMIGARETRQLRCSYQVTFEDIITGREFEDAVVYCAYPPDIHHHDKPGATFWYMDGIEEYWRFDCESEFKRWKTDASEHKTFWQLPYRAMLPKSVDNLLICGRAVDADKGAFSAIRSLICMNQTGEAAGVACYEALSSNKTVQDIDFKAMRRKMKQGGSIVFND